MSSHESRESRFDEPPEPDRPIPSSGVPEDADRGPCADPQSARNRTPQDELPQSPRQTAASPQDASAAADDPFIAAGAVSGQHDGDDDAERGSEAWDAHDPRRKTDVFAPPTQACACHCLHCGRTFSSEGIWFQKVINDPKGFGGFWMCPTPNCSGAGFTLDIFPIDPDHPANEGWHKDDDLDEDEIDDDDDDEQYDGDAPDQVDEEFDDPVAVDDSTGETLGESGNDDLWSATPGDAFGDNDEYDPAEPQYQEAGDIFGDGDDDDLEGEEWKYGLAPGERPPEPAWREEARREWEEDQKRYDEPDQRPRVLDWSDRDDRGDENPNRPRDGQFSDDDIPF